MLHGKVDRIVLNHCGIPSNLIRNAALVIDICLLLSCNDLQLIFTIYHTIYHTIYRWISTVERSITRSFFRSIDSLLVNILPVNILPIDSWPIDSYPIDI